MTRIFVSLEVHPTDPKVDPDEIAELMFDWACNIEDGRIDHIAGYDYTIDDGNGG